MRRLAVNRWLAFVLTLIILCSSGVFMPSRSYADSGVDPIVIGDSGPQQPAGDPDGPAGPTKRSGNRSVRNGVVIAVPVVGDGGSAFGVWKWRIQVVLQALRIRLSR